MNSSSAMLCRNGSCRVWVFFSDVCYNSTTCFVQKVFDDANVDLAVDGAMAAKFLFGGQVCIAPNRFMVQEGIHDEFVAKFAERMRDIKVGNGIDPRTTMGPLINIAAKNKVSNNGRPGCNFFFHSFVCCFGFSSDPLVRDHPPSSLPTYYEWCI